MAKTRRTLIVTEPSANANESSDGFKFNYENALLGAALGAEVGSPLGAKGKVLGAAIGGAVGLFVEEFE